MYHDQSFALNKHKLEAIAKDILFLKDKYKDSTFLYEKLGFMTFLLDKKELPIKCNFSSKILQIKYNGTLVVCSAIDKSLGNIFRDSLNTLYENVLGEMKLILTIPNSCIACDYAELCRGGCKSYSYSTCGNYRLKDDCCYFKALDYDHAYTMKV